MATAEDRILLLLSMKEEGKWIDFGHIAEKVIRDEKGKITEADVKKTLDDLVSIGLVSEKKEYIITEKGRAETLRRIKKVGDELNLSYRRVLVAKDYYPKIADALVPFLRGRATSVVKVFSDEKNPIHEIKSLFVRYSKYKPKKVFLNIETAEELLEYVNSHAIDFIPYVHRLDSMEPDWLILDLDAGPAFKDYARGFELIKIAAEDVVEVLEDYAIEPCIKFSGSRGIQIWASLDNRKLPAGDLFAQYRAMAIFIRRETEQKIQDSDSIDEFYRVTKKGKPITTSVVAKKEERDDQILIDWSSMKPNGDVRAPFSIHYKTGLVSCPIAREHLLDFKIGEAEPDAVAKKVETLKEEFMIKKSDPSRLYKRMR